MKFSLILATSLLFLIGCWFTDDSGSQAGTEVDQGMRVSAVLPDGKPAAGAKVVLLPASHLAPSKFLAKKEAPETYNAELDEGGVVFLEDIEDGWYSLSVQLGDLGAFSDSVEVVDGEASRDLKLSGLVSFKVPVPTGVQVEIRFSGTDISQKSETGVDLLLDSLPQGVYRSVLLVYNGSGQPMESILLIDLTEYKKVSDLLEVVIGTLVELLPDLSSSSTPQSSSEVPLSSTISSSSEAPGSSSALSSSEASSSSAVSSSSINNDPQYADRCIADGLGQNAPATGARLFDSFDAGENQVNFPAETGTFTTTATTVRFGTGSLDGTTNDPMYAMALVATQELFEIDWQVVAAVAGRESFAGLVQVPGASLYTETTGGSAAGAYGPWQIEQWSFGAMVTNYTNFFPDLACTNGKPDVLTAANDCGLDWATEAGRYLQTSGSSWISPGSAHAVNGTISYAMSMFRIFQMLTASTDLCFESVVSQAADQNVGLAALLPANNLGISSGFESSLNASNAAALIADPDGSSQFPMGNGNYRRDIFNATNAIVAASADLKTCGGSTDVYDTTFDLSTLQTFFFGDGGSVAVQGDGGLLMHFALSTQERTNLWSDVSNLFAQRASHWGGSQASFRYDFLLLVRAAKPYLNTTLPSITSGEAFNWITSHSTGPSNCP